MTDSAYRKTSLPSKLNLSDRNTREQLRQSQDDRRGELEGSSAAVAKQSDKACVDVMRQDLRDWLKEHDITGPPPSAEAEARAMWAWMRDFHKENNDDWFTRNMPRLHERFKPVFVDEMKQMKAAAAKKIVVSGPPAGPAAATASSGSDLLDFGAPAPAPDLLQLNLGSALPAPAAPSAPAVSAAQADSLLCEVYASPLPDSQVTAKATMPLAVPQIPAAADVYPIVGQVPANSGLDGLVDFGAITSTPEVASAPNASLDPFAPMNSTLAAAPAPNVSLDPFGAMTSTPSAATAPNVSLDPFGATSSTPSVAPAPNVCLDPFAAVDVGLPNKPKQDSNMLDLVF